MQRQIEPQSGHIYPAITIGDSSHLHAGDLHIYVDSEGNKSIHECHRVFKTTTYEDQKNRYIDRVEGTCQWVLTHPHFLSWRHNESNRLLWVSADPGCGKSVLAKSLIDRDLREELGQPSICYFFFKDNEIQDNLATALCAVLHQLFTQQPELIRHALPTWQKNGDKLQKEVGEMWRVLVQCALDPATRPIICILDALDECRDDDRGQLISMLCNLPLQSCTGTTKYNLKFLVTSRPYHKVQKWFEDVISRWPHIRLKGEDENEQIRLEINLVIEQHIRTLAYEFLLSAQRQEELRQQLLSMQHRTYLWLRLAMEEIFDAYRNSMYPEEEEIRSLPASVDQAYERILQRIDSRQRSNARKILLIVAGARRPLTIGELAIALAAAKPQQATIRSLVTPNQLHLRKQIREWCGLFIFIQHSTLFLIHQTAKEFLLSSDPLTPRDLLIWRGSLSVREVETEMAKLCVEFLCIVQHCTLQ